jgi:hypothetical protein
MLEPTYRDQVLSTRPGTENPDVPITLVYASHVPTDADLIYTEDPRTTRAQSRIPKSTKR